MERLLHFIVRFLKSDTIIGAGFFVRNGLAVTCWHVVPERYLPFTIWKVFNTTMNIEDWRMGSKVGGCRVIFLFIGAIVGGMLIGAYKLAGETGKSVEHPADVIPAVALIEHVSFFLGIVGVIFSFLLFEWWIPLIALATGYALVAPIIVNERTFEFFYKNRTILNLVKTVCSIALCGIYFKFI
ncbi:MAG: hypothetical protein R3C97_10985 [Geminicoccaceae bacterium]